MNFRRIAQKTLQKQLVFPRRFTHNIENVFIVINLFVWSLPNPPHRRLPAEDRVHSFLWVVGLCSKGVRRT
jgi:hypothetical protein